jgi:hypothetical protein
MPDPAPHQNRGYTTPLSNTPHPKIPYRACVPRKSIRPTCTALILARMRFNAPPISEHRLHRHHRWMLLWLSWFAAFLREARAFAPFSAQAEAIAHHWLNRIERLLISIVMLRAAQQVRFIASPRHSSRRRIETHMRRAIIGSAIRRALRSKDLNQRIAALSQNVDALVTRLLKRLPRGLTRRRPHHARPEPRAIARSCAHAEAEFAPDTPNFSPVR